MRILGIDPGYATIGFGLVDADRGKLHMVTYGAITTPAGLPLSKRLYQIGTDMEELIGKLKPDVISIEELFFNTNITTGIAVAHGRGVILYAAERCGIPLYEYTPSQVKMAVTGYGKAEKRQPPCLHACFAGMTMYLQPHSGVGYSPSSARRRRAATTTGLSSL